MASLSAEGREHAAGEARAWFRNAWESADVEPEEIDLAIRAVAEVR